MRTLPRQDHPRPSTFSAEEIADYVRANYRNDGDVYAQVRTALRQVCLQGFVIELTENEYQYIGPVASFTSGCHLHCKTYESARIRDNPSRKGRNAKNTARRTSLHLSARSQQPIAACDHCDDTLSDTRDDDRSRDTTVTNRTTRGHPFGRLPVRKAKLKKPIPRANDNDQEWSTEDDVDCACDADLALRNSHSTIRRANDRRVDEADEDTEDSAYKELISRERSESRERDLKRWIRRCREECKRRTARP